jgi:hypothetical protein
MWLLAVIVIAIISIAALRPGKTRRRFATAVSLRAGRAGERRVSRALRAAGGLAHLDDLVFTHNGVAVQIDHLIRTPDRIIVVETKHWARIIDPAAGAPAWTVRRRRSARPERRLNPLRQNAWHCEALSAAFNVPTQSLVVFTAGARFAGVRPANVLLLPELADRLARISRSRPEPRVSRAWARIAGLARSPRQSRLHTDHVARMRQQSTL